MKKISLLLLSVVMVAHGLYATLPMSISDIYVTNKYSKRLIVGPREKIYYGWDGNVMKREQVGPTQIIQPGQQDIKIASLERDQIFFGSRYGAIEIRFNTRLDVSQQEYDALTDEQRLAFDKEMAPAQQSHKFMSQKTGISIASTLTYTNNVIRSTRLPVMMDGLSVKALPKSGKIYQDVVMDFDPRLSY